MADIPKVRANVQTMIEKGAPKEHIDDYLAGEGLTYAKYLDKSMQFNKTKGIKTDVGLGRLFVQGLTLGWGDEIEAYARTLTGGDYEAVRDSIRYYTDEYREDNPVSSTAAEVVGALAPTAGAMIAAPFTGGASAAAVAPSLANTALRVIGAGAGSGALAGLGAGRGTPAEQAKSTAVGAGLGAGASVLGNAAIQGARGLYRAARPIVSKRGQEDIVGDILNRAATDPAAARASLRNAPEYVPGSIPTTAQAARDPGLAGLQTPVRSTMDDSSRISQRLSEQNEARQRVLGRISGESDQTIEAAKRKRNEVTGPMREKAFDASPISDKILPSGYTLTAIKMIDDLLKSPVGKRRTVSTALNSAKKQISKADNIRDLYEIRKDLRLAQLGRLSGARSDHKLARKELELVIKEIDNVLESAAPGYQNYMNRFAQMSRPIDQMTVLQALRNKSALAVPDVSTGQEILSQARFKREMLAKGIDDLSDSQKQQVNNILKDLNRSAAPTAPNVKIPGSDTAKNLTVANLIGQFSKNPNSFTQAIGSKLGWLTHWTEPQVQEALVDAMLDPKLAALFMQKATDTNISRISSALRSRLRQTGYAASAGTIGGLLTNQP